MNDFDDLDSLLGPLREPATPAELASEREMIDLMAKTHRHAKGTIMFSSRRARVATFIAAGVLGFGGVAAAGGGGLDLNDLSRTPVVNPATEDEVEEIDDEVEVEEVDEVDEIEVEDSDDDTFSDEIAKIAPAVVADATDDVDPNPETDFDENDCLEGNHGLTVSAVARGELEIDDIEVRDAAHSDCGKTADDATKVDDDATEVDDDNSDEDNDDEDHDDEDHGSGNRPEEPGRGKSQGDRGNGKPGDDD